MYDKAVNNCLGVSDSVDSKESFMVKYFLGRYKNPKIFGSCQYLSASIKVRSSLSLLQTKYF